jgi:DNA-binding response OmpR family regulator
MDDDPLLRHSLAFNLEQAGYRASTAASAGTFLPAAASCSLERELDRVHRTKGTCLDNKEIER